MCAGTVRPAISATSVLRAWGIIAFIWFMWRNYFSETVQPLKEAESAWRYQILLFLAGVLLFWIAAAAGLLMMNAHDYRRAFLGRKWRAFSHRESHRPASKEVP
jgi:Na+/proline symporter